MEPTETGDTGRELMRVLGAVGLAGAALFYLYFGIAAITQSLTQGILVFFGAGALAAGSFRASRGSEAALIVLVGTLPLFILQVGAAFMFEDESPAFAVIFGVAPVTAGLVWTLRRAVRQRGTR